jgi:hypothetical protein
LSTFSQNRSSSEIGFLPTMAIFIYLWLLG